MNFALIGNPNSGKTTLFNALTGSRAHVGNWPGVTVEKKFGAYKKLPEKVNLVDLPGIYSLSPYSPEEIVSRNYIICDKPEVIINIVDATNLERNLYLTTQLLEMEAQVVVALNFMDVIRKNGTKIDVDALVKFLGVPVVEVSALKGSGIDELMRCAYDIAKKPRQVKSVLKGSELSGIYQKTVDLLTKNDIHSPVFHAVKLIEGDEIEMKVHGQISQEVNEYKKAEQDLHFDGDYAEAIADARYQIITEFCKSALVKPPQTDELTINDKIDRVMTHKIWGIPIFLGIMLVIFHITFSEDFLLLSIFGVEPIMSPGVFLLEAMVFITEAFTELVSGWLSNSPEWISGLICDAILGGLGAVLSFLPQILLLFLFISILEDSGYMARVAFIVDRLFRRFGLSGRAFMPILMCFGCAVPGILATRTLENEQERTTTTLLAPFFSCGAKLPIWAAFGAVMYAGQHGDLVVFSMYLIGIVVAVLAAFVLKVFFLKGEAPPFIMELPSYHPPRFKNTMAQLWNKLKDFLYKAATIITGATVIIWFLTSFSFTFQMVDMEDSILAIISKGIRYIFIPAGIGMGADGWKFVVALLTGLIAKEMVVVTLGVFSGMGDDVLENENLLDTALAALILPLSAPAAFAFMAFNLLSVPCMAAVGAAKGELVKPKKLLFAIGFWMATAYIISGIIYWVGTYWWIGIILAVVLAALIAVYFVNKKRKLKLAKQTN